MTLNEKEKECLQFLINCDQRQANNLQREVIMKALGVERDAYKALIRKMEEIKAVYDVAQGMGQDYAEYFKISAPALLQEIWQMLVETDKQKQ